MMKNSTRSFDLADVLSVTTGFLVSPRGVEAVYDVVDFMEDTEHMTHQLPRACKECRPFLYAQHPFLSGIRAPAVRDGAGAWVDPWMTDLRAQHGARLSITSVPLAQRVVRDPIDELRAMVPDDKIIVVDLDER